MRAARSLEWTLGAFGEKLRKQREHRGITLEAVANTTKISTRMLKALEDEHFDQLPGGVFNKGFVRAYARQVGLNEEEAVNDYLAALVESQVQSQTVVPNFRSAPTRSASENKPSSPIRRDVPNTTAPEDRRIHSERRVETRRVFDRPSAGPGMPSRPAGEGRFGREVGTKAGLTKNHPPEQHTAFTVPSEALPDHTGLKDGPPISDRPIDGHEPGNYLETAVITQSTFGGVDEPRTNPETLAPEHHPEEDNFDDAPSSPPSFLNLSGPSFHEESPKETEYFEPPPLPRVPSPPIPWQRLAIPLLLLVIVIAFVAFLRHSQSASRSQAVSSPGPRMAASSAASVAPAAAIASVAPAKPSAIANTASGTTPDSPRYSSDENAPSNSVSSKSAKNESSDVSRVIPARAATSKPKPLPAFTLIIRASENSSVSITADGQPVAQENLIAPAATSVRATKEIVVKAGNAAGISFMLDGKDIPAAGHEGEFHTYTFDANGLHDPASADSN